MAAIGWTLTIPVPDVDDQIALGYTGIRVYTAGTEDGSYSLATTLTLVSGTYSYSYNNTTGNVGDWEKHGFYGTTPGLGPLTEPQVVGPVSVTRKAVRQGVGLRLGLCRVETVASSADGTHCLITNLIDPDASASTIANRIIRVTSGTYADQVRRIRAGSTGYAVATGILTVNRTFGGALSANDEVEIWKAVNDQDTSAMVDLEIQSARGSMSYESHLIIVTADSQSVYPLPVGVTEKTVKRIEYSARSSASTYPDDPDWRVCPFARISGTELEVGSDVYGARFGLGTGFTANTILRLTYNAMPDLLQSDSDSWNVPELTWAIAEVGVRTLARVKAASNSVPEKAMIQKDMADLQAECVSYRKFYWPTVGGTVVPAR